MNNGTSIESLEFTENEIKRIKDTLRENLEKLTTQGNGILYELKVAVGENSDLGEVIAQLGGAVMKAQNNVIQSLTNLGMLIHKVTLSQNQSITAAENENKSAAEVISNIDFS